MLAGQQLNDAIAALLDAFRLPGELNIVVGVADIGLPFSNFTVAGNLQATVDNLLQYADAQGQVTKLLKTAVGKAPGNPKLQKVWRQFAPLDAELAGYGTDLPTFEALLFKARPFADIVPFLTTLSARRRAVCRIEPQPLTQSKQGFGSGFLVAPDVVITNAHVADEFYGPPGTVPSRVPASQVRVRFDAERDAAGVEGAGTPVELAADFRILYSDRFALDFALLRLARPAPDPEDGSPRGFLTPLEYPFDPTVPEPLAILQHPAAAPLQLAFGVLTADPPPPNRVRYAVNTEGGSSGSPVMTQGLEVVALHHAPGGRASNQGVPFSAIKAHWRQPGPRAALVAAGLSRLVP